MKKLLLVSNSTLHGSGYLDHCESEIKSFLGSEIKKVTFVPFARPSGISYNEYAGKASERFRQIGYELESVHEHIDPVQAIRDAEAVFIGGGNTFVLLSGLYDFGLVDELRNKVMDGIPYIGTSAGSNITCPTIMTTNDMPVRELGTFTALNLIPFQINPHYLDPEPGSTHKGETRETRINEYLVFNDLPVVGLREGCMIHVEGDKYTLKGSTGARIFSKGKEPAEVMPPVKLNSYLS